MFPTVFQPGTVAKLMPIGGGPAYIRVLESMISTTPYENPDVTIKGYLIHEAEAHANLSAATAGHGLAYKKVIFNPPATIVLWKDGSKTVVKCDERDTYDARTGLALCFMKKALGNKSRAVNDILHKELVDG